MKNRHQKIEPYQTSRAYVCNVCLRATVDEPHREPPMPCHAGRAEMCVEDRAWLRHPSHRDVVARIWQQIESAPVCLLGSSGNLDGDALEDAGVPEGLVSHWREVRYADDGSRAEIIPGPYVARDLRLLGLPRDAVMKGTVEVELPSRCRRCRPQPAVVPAAVPAVTQGSVSAVVEMEVRHGR